jgi:hypothetical protein
LVCYPDSDVPPVVDLDAVTSHPVPASPPSPLPIFTHERGVPVELPDDLECDDAMPAATVESGGDYYSDCSDTFSRALRLTPFGGPDNHAHSVAVLVDDSDEERARKRQRALDTASDSDIQPIQEAWDHAVHCACL